MSGQKPCKWFHRWEGTEHFAGMFKLVSRCRKCDLHKVENVLTERVEYGWYTPPLSTDGGEK